MKFYTLGVYGSTEEDFFQKLIDSGIDLFCDIRQRRGVRGLKYNFINSIRLQQKLNSLNIKYEHIIELAPTTEIREFQKEADAQKGERKNERKELGEIFKIEYKNRILDQFNFENFIEKLDKTGVKNIVFFCVEENAEACHRSLVINQLKTKYNFDTIHL
jgi:uncharacterized protein (DUF488 family)